MLMGDGIVNGQDIALIASNWNQTAVTAAQPEIQLDATNTASVGIQQGGDLFAAAKQQYLTETDNATLDRAVQWCVAVDDQYAVEQTTTGLDRALLSRWNYGGRTGHLCHRYGPPLPAERRAIRLAGRP